MVLNKIFPSSGGGRNVENAKKAIRLVRHGCGNRPFYHIVVMQTARNQHEQPIEQLGTFDPMPNERNEKLVSFNFERIRYWIGMNADVSVPVRELLGLSGFLPVYPRSYMTAWRKRQADQEAAKASDNSASSETTNTSKS